MGYSLREGGGAVALLVELLSVSPNLAECSAVSVLPSVGTRSSVELRASTPSVARGSGCVSGQDPAEFALHSLQIGGASRLAAGGRM